MTNKINNPIFQELPSEQKLFSESDERLHIDLRDSRGYTKEIEKLSRNDSKLVLKVELKNMLLRKMRLRVWGYLQGEYLYILGTSGLTLKYRTYSVVTQDDELEELKQYIRKCI